MNRKSLLPPGLYRIYMTLPVHVRRLTDRWGSKLRTSWMLIVLIAASPAHADVADMVARIKPGVVGVGTFNPTGSPRGNLQGTGFAVLDGRYVVSCAHIFVKPLDSEKKETHAIFIGRDRQVTVRPATLIATDTRTRSGAAENRRRSAAGAEARRFKPWHAKAGSCISPATPSARCWDSIRLPTAPGWPPSFPFSRRLQPHRN